MKMLIPIFCFCLVWSIASWANAQGAAGGQLIKALGKFLVKQTGETASEQAVKKMSHEVGEELIERTAQKVIREGGEQSLVEVSQLVAKHGPEVIRALDNAPDAAPVLRLLGELPADDVAKASLRLAAGNTGKELATLSTKLGTNVLRAEAKHPGVGLIFAKTLGEDGAELSLKLSTDQAVQIGRHVEDIAKLPKNQQSQLIELISNNTDRFATFVGRFVENNPGKVLFTAAGTTLVLTESERILGGDEIAIDKDGNPVVVTKPGLVGRVTEEIGDTVKAPVQWTLYLLGGIVAIALSLIAGSKVWKHIRKDFPATPRAATVEKADRKKKKDQT